MSHAMTTSQKPSFKALWRVGDATVGRVNAGWTTSNSGHPCPCQNCLQGPPAEKTGRESLLNSLSCPSNDPTGQGTELNFSLYFPSPLPPHSCPFFASCLFVSLPSIYLALKVVKHPHPQPHKEGNKVFPSIS